MPMALRDVAAIGLRTASHLGGEDPEPVTDAVVEACERDGLLGLLATAVRRDVVVVGDEPRAVLESRLRASLTRDLHVERQLLQAVQVLDRAHIDSRVLGSVALARTVYDEPAERSVAAVELLVPEHELDHAAELFASRAREPATVDGEVAVQLASRVGRTITEAEQVPDLFAPPYRFPIGALEMEALPMPQRLFAACDVAADPGAPLVALRDVAQIVLRERPNLVDVLLMARRWSCEQVVAVALTRAWDELVLVDHPPILQWARDQQARAGEG